MNKYCHLFILALFSALLAARVFADDLKVVVYCRHVDAYETKTEGVFRHPARVAVTNCSDRALRIPTASNSKMAIRGKKGAITLWLYFQSRQLTDGTTAVEPEARFAPVELLPKETVVIEMEFTAEEDIAVEKLAVTYEVEESFKRRYGLWAGEIHGKAIDASPYASRFATPNSGKQ